MFHAFVSVSTLQPIAEKALWVPDDVIDGVRGGVDGCSTLETVPVCRYRQSVERHTATTQWPPHWRIPPPSDGLRSLSAAVTLHNSPAVNTPFGESHRVDHPIVDVVTSPFRLHDSATFCDSCWKSLRRAPLVVDSWSRWT